MPITDEKVEEIRRRADIGRIIGAHVALRKQGKRLLGLCPFHGEKTPSFSVNPERGAYYCFGCHEKGDVFTFVGKVHGLDFPGAVRWLAKEVGVEVDPESPAEQKKRKLETSLAQVNAYAHAFFTRVLWHDAGAKRARGYLDERKIPEAFARDRELGYGGAPGELLAYLTAKKVPGKLAAAAGLLTEDGRRCLFEERLIFPIKDLQGRIAGFGGRRLGEGSSPKYVNTRESALFSKRTLLYGWDVAQEHIRRTKRVIVVEGYTDVLACQRAGNPEAVAALGTAFTDEHASLIARFATEALVLMDSDAAGIKASREVAERLIAAKLKTQVVALPEGDDPDSLLREKGADALQVRLKQPLPAVEHFMALAFAKPQMSVEDKAAAAQGLASLFAALGPGLERDLYMARLAERVGVGTAQLEEHLKGAMRAAAQKHKDEQQRARRAAAEARGEAAPGRAGPQSHAGRGAAAGHADDGPPPSDADAPPPPEEAGPPPEPPKPKPPADDLTRLCELLIYPKLRARFGELAEFASEPMQPILKSLAETSEPPEVILERHEVGPRWVHRVQKIEPAPDDAEAEERAERTFSDVLDRFKRQHLQAARTVKLAEIAEAQRRGEPTEELENQLKGLTRGLHKLKRASSRA